MSSGESSAERESFLDRFRIDIPIPVPQEADLPQGLSPSRATPSDISKFLLPVDDVHVIPESADPAEHPAAPLLYIDLGSEFSDEALTNQALTQLVIRGIDLVVINPYTRLSLSGPSTVRVEWKAEGNTARLLRKMTQWSE